MRRDKDRDTFARKVFRSSRLADFATRSELIRQTGHPVEAWPLVVVKELVDNALDAAEEAGTAPRVSIVVEDDAITVEDQGPGIAPATVKSLIDYSVKTSSRAAYVSPSRGAQGNALQTILAMPFALDGRAGRVTIESQGIEHVIDFTVDPVRQTPIVKRTVSPSAVKIGACVTVGWPAQASSLITDVEHKFLSLITACGWFNPHLALEATWCVGEKSDYYCSEATSPDWSKWRPSQPTSPHWYTADRLRLLMAAEIAFAEDNGTAWPSVRDFIRQFRNLSGTGKANEICKLLGVAERETLADFFKREHEAKLLEAMRERSRPVRPGDLGVVGADHLAESLAGNGCDRDGVAYRKAEIEHDGLPYGIEVAFGYRGEGGARILEGFNFSAAIGGSPFELGTLLANAHIEKDDPVSVVAHVTSPRLDFLDKGKARVALPAPVADRLAELVTTVSSKWTKQKRAEIRDYQAIARRHDAMIKRDKPMSIKDAAYAAMPEAYLKASDGGRLPVKPRQIMYAARPQILEMTGKQTFDDNYFTQTLLVGYIRDHPEETADWDIIWDDRGHFSEAHTGREIGLGTLPVREYIEGLRPPTIVPAQIADARVSTFGPDGRYGAILFIEKEGFEPIFQAAGIYERYDLAPMSTKGMSTTAGRTLVEELCGKRGLPLFVLHDFDKSGFSIHETLINDTERYAFEHALENVVETGLRLADVERLGLQSEQVVIKEKEKAAARNNLRKNGATQEEIAFLIDGLPEHDSEPRRVELNAMTSSQLVDLVEDRLIAHGVGKVVPDSEMLAETFTAFKRSVLAQAALAAELARLNTVPVDVPDDLEEQVHDYLEANREAAWDAAVKAIMADER